MLAEVVRYRPYDDYIAVVIQVEQVKLYVRLKQGKDMNGKPVGYTLWISDSPLQYATEQAAIEAACRYAERMVLGVVTPGANDTVELLAGSAG